jgi:hypothetical protein
MTCVTWSSGRSPADTVMLAAIAALSIFGDASQRLVAHLSMHAESEVTTSIVVSHPSCCRLKVSRNAAHVGARDVPVGMARSTRS